MSQDMGDHKQPKQIGLISIITPYAIVVCALYLFGFWSSFDINILEYMSFPDVLRLSIYPVFIGSIFYVGFILIRSFLIDIDNIKKAKSEKVFINVSHKFARWSSLAAVILGIVLMTFIKGPIKWTYAGLLAFYILIISIDDISILVPLIPNPVIRRLVFVSAILIITSSFGTGKYNAELIISGSKAMEVSTNIFREKGSKLFQSKGLLEGQETLKYIGTAGDHIFFLSMDNTRTYIVKYSDLHYIELSGYKR